MNCSECKAEMLDPDWDDDDFDDDDDDDDLDGLYFKKGGEA